MDLSKLYTPVIEMVNGVIKDMLSLGHEIYIPPTGLIRESNDQIRIYGKEQWTVHYIGCAVDFHPRIQAKTNDEWTKQFNSWKYWDLLQCEVAVKNGFDKPQKWQLQRDRPHCQVLFGIPESQLKTAWYKCMDINQIHSLIDDIRRVEKK